MSETIRGRGRSPEPGRGVRGRLVDLGRRLRHFDSRPMSNAMKIVKAREIIDAWDDKAEPDLTATEDEALDIVEAAGYSCPTCGAEPDEECSGKSTHKRRIRKIAKTVRRISARIGLVDSSGSALYQSPAPLTISMPATLGWGWMGGATQSGGQTEAIVSKPSRGLG